ncbi:MAG: RNA methyltransferase [Cyanobacteria bacterium P01_A01_bin.37]
MISSIQNPLIKQFRKLHKSKERHRQRCFLIEGTHLIEEAIATDWPLDAVCCTESWHERNLHLWSVLQTNILRCEWVTDDVMAAIATTVNPDGVMAIAHRRAIEFSARPDPCSTLQLGIALETIQDPGNVGTIIRSAMAGGADGLWVSADSVDLDHPKVLRASAGQWFRLPMMTSSALEEDLKRAQDAGIQIVATSANSPLAYWNIDLTIPTIIVAGNEGAGLSESIVALSDKQVCIPISPDVESLNVAIAVSLLIFEANRQRNVKEFSANEVK